MRSLFDELAFVSPAGKVLVDSSERGRRGVDVSDREYFQHTVATRQPYISAPFMARALNQPIVVLTAPVIAANGELVGVLSGSLNLLRPNFLGRLSEMRIGNSGSFALFTRERLIVMSSDKSRIMTTGPAPGVSPYFDRATSVANVSWL